MLAVSRRSVDAARAGYGPTFVESRTARWPGNYGSSPTLSLGGETDIAWAWSPEGAPQPRWHWLSHSDPVLVFARRLLETEEADRQTLLGVDSQVRDEIHAAAQHIRIVTAACAKDRAQLLEDGARLIGHADRLRCGLARDKKDLAPAHTWRQWARRRGDAFRSNDRTRGHIKTLKNKNRVEREASSRGQLSASSTDQLSASSKSRPGLAQTA